MAMSTVVINTQIVNLNVNSPPSIPETKQAEEKKEIWKSIIRKGIPPQYQISTKGRLRNPMLRIRKLRLNKGDGYYYVTIKRSPYPIHDLVGRAFIPKPESDKKLTIDHIDLVRTNNNVENLRWATDSQQGHHRKKVQSSTKQFTSKYKGVSFRKSEGRWIAQVKVDKRKVYQELFDNEMEAAAAYDRKAKEFFGEFAETNDIENSQEYQDFKKSQKWRKKGFKNSSSRYYGVKFDDGKFQVNINNPKEKKWIYGGRFDSEKEAARKANEEFIKIYGADYKKLNVISSDEEEEEESNKRVKYTEEEKSNSQSSVDTPL